MTSFQHPFHRLLTFFARQRSLSSSGSSSRIPATTKTTSGSTSSITTIRFIDSLRGDLALGFNFPISVLLSLARHIIFRTGPGIFSLSIHIPSVKLDRKLLGGPGAYSIDPEKRYSLTEVMKTLKDSSEGGNLKDQLDAFGIWTMAAERKDGKITGRDLRDFQEGTVLDNIAKRRRTGRDDVLPFWRGGPLS